TVILYDLVCAGSVNPDYFDFHRYTTLEPYVDDLLNILYAHRIDRCAYVGHSVSAMIGLLASIRRPSSSPSSSSSAPPPGPQFQNPTLIFNEIESRFRKFLIERGFGLWGF
ncbi:unnamed protein product, partial [Linum tenue]